MKKNIKRLISTVTVVFALVGVGGITAFAAGYVTWGGTDDFNSLMSNLQTIGDRATGLKGKTEEQATEIAILTTDKAAKEKTISDLQDSIDNLQNTINEKDKEIQGLKDRGPEHVSTKKELEQAEIDMKKAKDKSEEVLNSIGAVE